MRGWAEKINFQNIILGKGAYAKSVFFGLVVVVSFRELQILLYFLVHFWPTLREKNPSFQFWSCPTAKVNFLRFFAPWNSFLLENQLHLPSKPLNIGFPNIFRVFFRTQNHGRSFPTPEKLTPALSKKVRRFCFLIQRRGMCFNFFAFHGIPAWNLSKISGNLSEDEGNKTYSYRNSDRDRTDHVFLVFFFRENLLELGEMIGFT